MGLTVYIKLYKNKKVRYFKYNEEWITVTNDKKINEIIDIISEIIIKYVEDYKENLQAT